MIDPSSFGLLRGRVGFAAIIAALIFVALMPTGGEAGRLPGPDWMTCVVFAWIMRRPDFAPLWLLSGAMLAADVLLMRPFGLWAALVVLAAEIIRARAVLMRELNFLMEWAVVSALMLIMLLAYRFGFAVTLLPQVSLGSAMMQWLWSVIAYPAVVLLTTYVFALRKPSLGQVDAYGRKF